MFGRRPTFRFVVIGIIIIAAIFLAAWFFVPWSRQVFQGAISPFQRVFFKLAYKITGIKDYWQSYDELTSAKIALADKVAELEKKTVDYNTIKQENEDLKEELKFIKTHKEFKMLVAGILSQSLLPENQILVINKGLKDDVSKGDSVISDGNLIGRIGQIDNYTSQVILLTDNNSQVAGRLQNEAKTSGMIKGEHGLGLILDLIPKSEIINVGDYAVTSGLETNVPAQLLIGQVAEIKNSSQDIFQKVIITPLINYHKIDLVTIILSNG